MAPDQAQLARFATDLDQLVSAGERIGIAVSGGADSLALLLLGAAARPGLVEAVTVDHALRPDSKAEADFVGHFCSSRGVPHKIMTVEWGERPTAAIQERARQERYRLIGQWMIDQKLQLVCTGHHRDDQAETLLMRLARGVGLSGLAAIRPVSALPGSSGLTLVRPLLNWRRHELAEICAAADVGPIDDPSNADPRFERARVRRHIAQLGINAGALGRSADHLRAADEAIEWAVDQEWMARVRHAEDGMTYSPGDAPREIRRRIVARLITALATEGAPDLRGRELDRLLDTLELSSVATLRGVRAQGGRSWRFTAASPRTLVSG
ncbi:MAG TPA: tRNA lysidine(34) synthetase TilS [Sphingomicrobium sp.]|nr:tRNA lysidine(34) synthetase TilS [Sphingomicrobium sp.]